MLYSKSLCSNHMCRKQNLFCLQIMLRQYFYIVGLDLELIRLLGFIYSDIYIDNYIIYVC